MEWLASLYGEIFRGGYIARGTKVLEKLPIKTIDFSKNDERLLHDKIASLQETLISLNEKMLINKDNRRQYELLEKEFNRNKHLIDNALLSLYEMTQEELDKIPNIKDFYAVN